MKRFNNFFIQWNTKGNVSMNVYAVIYHSTMWIITTVNELLNEWIITYILVCFLHTGKVQQGLPNISSSVFQFISFIFDKWILS